MLSFFVLFSILCLCFTQHYKNLIEMRRYEIHTLLVARTQTLFRICTEFSYVWYPWRQGIDCIRVLNELEPALTSPVVVIISNLEFKHLFNEDNAVDFISKQVQNEADILLTLHLLIVTD